MYFVTGFIGLVALFAPFVFNYTTEPGALFTSLAVGTVLLIDALMEWADEEKRAWEYWLGGVVGVLAVLAPFVLKFTGLIEATWTMVIVGAAAVVISAVKLFPGRS